MKFSAFFCRHTSVFVRGERACERGVGCNLASRTRLQGAMFIVNAGSKIEFKKPWNSRERGTEARPIFSMKKGTAPRKASLSKVSRVSLAGRVVESRSGSNFQWRKRRVRPALKHDWLIGRRLVVVPKERSLLRIRFV